MIKETMDYIKEKNMLEDGDRIVIGVSGGADSIALLYILYAASKKIDIKLYVVHINHGVRGEEAKEDEEYVKEVCKNLDLEFKVYRYDMIGYAKEEGISEEEAGRKLRYKSFYHATNKYDANKIATGHNKNDNAETILFHLFRGSGIKGLTGISHSRKMKTQKQDIEIIRPILGTSREVLEKWLEEQGIEYKIDSTNLTDDYTRNKIRNKVITYVSREINTSAIDNIVKAGEHLDEINSYLEKNIENGYESIVRDERNKYRMWVDDLKKEDIVIQKGVIRRVLEKTIGSLKNIESKHVAQVIDLYDKPVGKRINLPNQRVVKRGYKDIVFFVSGDKERADIREFEWDIPLSEGEYIVEEINKIIGIRILNYDKKIEIPKKRCTKWFDYDKIDNTIKIRTRRTKDYIQVHKDGGNKKIKDYFINIKIPKKDRDNVVLIAKNSHIIWIIDDRAKHRVSEKYKVSKHTKKILEIKISELGD